MLNVTAIACLNELPVITMCFNPFADNVRLVTGAYFRDLYLSKTEDKRRGIK